MKKDMQDKINEQLLDYCDELEKKIQDQTKRLDDYIDILEAIAEKIEK